MDNFDEFLSQFNRAELSRALGLKSPTAIDNCRANKKFPSSWFKTMEDLCLERGIDCPRELFNWRGAA